MDLEASRKPSGFEDIFIGYHVKDDVQSTYAGTLFHKSRNYHVSSLKREVSSTSHFKIFISEQSLSCDTSSSTSMSLCYRDIMLYDIQVVTYLCF